MYDRAPRVLTGATGSTTDEVGPGKYEPDAKRSLDRKRLHFLHCLHLRHVKGGRGRKCVQLTQSVYSGIYCSIISTGLNVRDASPCAVRQGGRGVA